MSARVFMRHRLEPISRAGDAGKGLAATFHDAYWALGRQWQFGELTGEDAGSPVEVRIRLATAAISSWHVPGGPPQPLDPDGGVVEATITGERSAGEVTVKDRLDAGRRLAAMVSPAARAALAAVFPLPVPDGSVWTAARGRVPDGLAAAAALAGTGGDAAAIAGLLGLGAVDAATVLDVLGEFVEWTTTTFGLGPDCWAPPLVERRFDLDVPGAGVVLQARNHTRAGLDWFDVDVDVDDAGGDGTSDLGVEDLVRLPGPVRFPGMPADRFWEFEDAELALHAIDAGTTDLARLALVEFSTVYGNDWFTVPVPIRYGTISRVDRMLVVDTFGRTQLIRPGLADGAPWAMFAVSRPSGGAVPWLVTPPLTVGALRGPTVEDVTFTRDEMANLVWAVERLVTDADGRVHDLVAEYAARVDTAAQVPTDAELLYRLMTDVPEHWVPFVPVHLDAGRRRVGLVQAVLPRASGVGEPTVVEPRSAVLSELRHVAVDEREVPPSGVAVRRSWWLARAPDGRRVTWAARAAGPGRGEGASGLAFDVADDVRSRP